MQGRREKEERKSALGGDTPSSNRWSKCSKRTGAGAAPMDVTAVLAALKPSASAGGSLAGAEPSCVLAVYGEATMRIEHETCIVPAPCGLLRLTERPAVAQTTTVFKDLEASCTTTADRTRATFNDPASHLLLKVARLPGARRSRFPRQPVLTEMFLVRGV
jgi:hypothetical protein